MLLIEIILYGIGQVDGSSNLEKKLILHQNMSSEVNRYCLCNPIECRYSLFQRKKVKGDQNENGINDR